MSNALATTADKRNEIAAKVSEVYITGNLARLSEPERLNYYMDVCNSLGLNPTTKPFAYCEYQGKLILYATRNCTDQLRKIHKVTMTTKPEREIIGDLLIYTVTQRDAEGREETDIGAIFIGGLRGKELADATMKCLTKAKRRTTLALCGLSVIDESEIEDSDLIPAYRDGPTKAELAPPKTAEVIEAENAEREKLLKEFTEDFNICSDAKTLPLDWRKTLKDNWGVTSLKGGNISLEQVKHLKAWIEPYLPKQEDQNEV